MVALFLSGYTLSFTAMIGFVALMGIEVKNSILLVDFTNQLRQQGWPLDDAIQEAGEKRFVPILLTTLTAIGGLIPLALERSALYSPLALVILGGLVSSTVLTRVVTPVHLQAAAAGGGAGADRAPARASGARVRDGDGLTAAARRTEPARASDGQVAGGVAVPAAPPATRPPPAPQARATDGPNDGRRPGGRVVPV